MMKQTDNSHTPQVSVAVIDNYDSFTYNLVHLVRSPVSYTHLTLPTTSRV